VGSDIEYLSKTVDNLSAKLDQHITATVDLRCVVSEMCGQVEKSFSKLNKDLQLHQHNFEVIHERCSKSGQRIAVTEADLSNLVSSTRDQWTEINKLRGQNQPGSPDEKKMFQLFPLRFVGFSARDLVLIIAVLGILYMIFAYHGILPSRVVGNHAPQEMEK